MSKQAVPRIAFIGSVGIPNRYGGFEAFLEHTCPSMLNGAESVTVTCAESMYPGERGPYEGVDRVFIPCEANGVWSIFHDLLAFMAVVHRSSHIVVLGVSGGLWFPLFRCICLLTGKRLLVNVDGVEWKRGKFSHWKRAFLWCLDYMAQRFSHTIIIDNASLQARFPTKAVVIAYPGDHVLRVGAEKQRNAALTVCRIEPENNIELLILGVLGSRSHSYVFIGNWENSEYGRGLRRKYSGNTRLRLLDPIYDQTELAHYREECSSYVHGHSVGGTNPSLVEMVYYDCHIYCFDVSYHHTTVGAHARYFRSAKQLSALLDLEAAAPESRDDLRVQYSRERISRQYLGLCI